MEQSPMVEASVPGTEAFQQKFEAYKQATSPNLT